MRKLVYFDRHPYRDMSGMKEIEQGEILKEHVLQN